ncbi:MAG TPA: hypothetical protein PLZ12_16280 [Saprospiraceae bacterium]|nr:hypothetical protein [Saprospiraceae bacterium]
MHFEAFFTQFPNVAEHETRVLTVLKNADTKLPVGEYGFVEFFCKDRKCDCRRVMVQVFGPDMEKTGRPTAVFSYGWEPKSFYRSWFPFLPDEELNWFKGPAIDPYQPQSQYSQELFGAFLEMLKDKNYKERIIRHYVMQKQKSGMKTPKDLLPWSSGMRDCGCGSGLKFKDCCGKDCFGRR